MFSRIIPTTLAFIGSGIVSNSASAASEHAMITGREVNAMVVAKASAINGIIRLSVSEDKGNSEIISPGEQEAIQLTRSTLGQRLRDIRAKIVASGEPLVNWEELEREKATRRRYQDVPVQ